MFQFKKKCDDCECLTPAERKSLLGERAKTIIEALRSVDVKSVVKTGERGDCECKKRKRRSGKGINVIPNENGAEVNTVTKNGVDVLAETLISTTVVGDKIDEREYMLIYPALIKVFGYEYDLNGIKKNIDEALQNGYSIANRADDITAVAEKLDKDLIDDTVALCLSVVAVNGKLPLKKRLYMRRLFSGLY